MKKYIQTVKKTVLASSVSIFAILSFITAVPIGNTALAAPADVEDCKVKSLLGIPPWYRGLQCYKDTGSPVLESNIGKSITIIVLNIVNILFSLAGYIAAGFVVWGSIRYIIAGGEPSNLAAAKKTIANALIGLLIVLSAIAIVNFVVSLY